MSRLLTQNSELRPHNVWNWTIPAWFVRLPNGSIFHTCPNAGVCAQVCYARNGTYRFRNVAAAHMRNLMLVLEHRAEWRERLHAEIAAKPNKPRTVPGVTPNSRGLDAFTREWLASNAPAVRIHDAGDFFARWYLDEWLAIAAAHPTVLFYAYTKEVSMLRAAQEAATIPINFRYLFSTGGLEDALIGEDRHAEVFPTEGALRGAGYTSQDASDLLAVLLPTTRIGIPANNIPHFNKRLAGRTFGEMQVDVRARRTGANLSPGGTS